VILWRTALNETLPWWTVVFLPGAYGPSIAAVILTARRDGSAGVVALLRLLVAWRVELRWYAFVLLLPITLVACALLASGFRSTALAQFDVVAALSIAPLALVAALPFGPLAEELGWRGYSLPRLVTKQGVWIASLVIGLAWSFWHLPMFWFPGAAIPGFLEPSPQSVLLFTAQITAEACLLTFVWCKTGGSVLMAVLFHLTFNTAETILFWGLPEPEPAQQLQIYVLNIVFMWIAAVAALGSLPKTSASAPA
jgi:membrane protease YdiL (CAAX protease family)